MLVRSISDRELYVFTFSKDDGSSSFLRRNSAGIITDVLQYGHFIVADPSLSKSNGAEQLGQLKLWVIISISNPLSILYYISKLSKRNGVNHYIAPS
jgi:hypothetical protein